MQTAVLVNERLKQVAKNAGFSLSYIEKQIRFTDRDIGKVYMQDFSLAFGRVTRSTMAAHPELKNLVVDLMQRAYHNLYAKPLNNADPKWVSSISAAALQLSFDARVQSMNTREVTQLFENMILISEEHQREARRHAAMACNAFYLKETALDALLSTQHDPFHPADTTVIGQNKSHTGRIEVEKPGEPLAS